MFRSFLIKKTNSADLCFWQGVVGKKALVDEHEATINRLVGGFTASQLERACVDNRYVYIFRLSQADRLLSTTVMVGEQYFLMPLEVVENHDYQKARFLQSGVLKRYIEKHEEAILGAIRNQTQQAVSSDSVALQKIIIPRITFDHNKWVAFDEEQDQVLSDAGFPAIIGGWAGTGKTTVALTMLVDYLQTKAVAGDKLLYVARSASLLQDVKLQFRALNVDKENVTVVFATYDELDATLSQDKQVGEEEAKAWLTSEYLPRQRNQVKARNANGKGKQKVKQKETHNVNDLLLTELQKGMDKIYQHWRIISALSLENALVLNPDEKCFAHPELERMLYAALVEYRAYLAAKKSRDSGLCPLEVRPRYAFTVVDEAPDLSNLQLVQLAGLTLDQQICYFMDVNQNIYDNISKRPFLIRELGKEGRNVRVAFLPRVHRCGENIALFGGKILDVSNTVAGGGADQFNRYTASVEVDSKKSKGEIEWYVSWDAGLIAKTKNKVKVIEYAVITEDAYREQAIRLFGTYLVFTPEEIKGLTYPVVVCYRLFDREEFKQANERLNGIPIEEYGKKIHRPKAGQAHQDYRMYFHRVFTSVMRGQSRVYIFQEKYHYLKHIVSYLDPVKNAISVDESKNAKVSLSETKEEVQTKPETTSEEYIALVVSLIRNGSIRQAQDVYLEQKLGTVHDFQKLLHKINEKSSLSEKSNKQLSLTKGAPTESSVTSQVVLKKSEREYEYVQSLFKSFTKKNVKALLTHKNVIRFLFGTTSKGVGGHPCLFDAIYNNEAMTKIFNSIIEDSHFSQTFFDRLSEEAFWIHKLDEQAEEKTPFASVVSRARVCISLLKRLFDTKPALLQRVTIDALCALEKLPGDEGYASALYWLAENPQGQVMLKALFDAKPALMQGVSAEALCALRKLSGDKGHDSALIWLAGTPEGQVLLTRLFEVNPSLLQGVSAEALCALRKLSGDQGYTSVLFWLAATVKSRRILTSLFEANPALMQEVTTEALFALRKLSGDKGHDSALYWLAGNPEGLMILKALFAVKPALVQGMSAEALCAQRKLPGGHGCESALYWLTRTLEGQEILNLLFDANPALLDQINIDNLLQMNTDIDGKVYAASLFFLTRDNEFALFDKIHASHPDLFEKVSLGILLRVFDPHPKRPLVDCLLIGWLQYENGRALLEKWLAIHTEDERAAVAKRTAEYEKRKHEQASLAALPALSVFSPEQNQNGKQNELSEEKKISCVHV